MYCDHADVIRQGLRDYCPRCGTYIRIEYISEFDEDIAEALDLVCSAISGSALDGGAPDSGI